MNWSNARAIPTVAVTDMKEGKNFYGNTLGLEETKTPVPELEGHTFFRCGDSHLCLYERPERAGSKATVFALEVNDVETTVAELRKKGVKFEDYDIPEMGIKTENGVATMNDFQTAWFTDPWGNVIGIDNGLTLLRKTGVTTAQSR